MEIIKDIKVERLLLAVGITILLADTVPHPQLSTGLMEQSLQWMQAELMPVGSDKSAIAGVNR